MICIVVESVSVVRSNFDAVEWGLAVFTERRELEQEIRVLKVCVLVELVSEAPCVNEVPDVRAVSVDHEW
jgi:hypothetical protein